MKHLRICILLLLAVTVFSCTIRNKDVVGEQNTIKGTDWVLLSYGEEAIPSLLNARSSFIHFNEENDKLHGFAGCNKFFGKFELNGDRLKIKELGSTRASCPDMEAENYLLGVLENVTSFNISQNALTLYSGKNAIATFQTSMGPDREQERMMEGQ